MTDTPKYLGMSECANAILFFLLNRNTIDFKNLINYIFCYTIVETMEIKKMFIFRDSYNTYNLDYYF